MAATWKAQLQSALDNAKHEGASFAVAGVDAGPLPQIAVRGVGKVALPIDAEQAEDLAFAGMPAPYGKGFNTELDPNVRKATQLDPGRVRFSADWDATLRRITVGVAAALGVPGGGAGIEARLYKLLVYERGGHFKSHRDTEKEPGMFGTLLVQLPVAAGHTGGKLSISHLGQKVEWDTAAAATAAPASGIRYAAFYADCEHELSVVESGMRVVLAFNLVRPQPTAQMTGPLSHFSNMAAAADAVTAAVRVWEDEGGAADPVVAIPLVHKYTKTNLGFGALKGYDAAKVQLLVACPLLDVHLVLIAKEVVGSTSAGACYGKRSRYRRWYDEDDEEVEDHATLARTAQMDDVLDESIDTGLWVSPLFGRLAEHRFGCSGISLPLEECLLDGQELFPRGLQPDKREYEGYTGNAGPELTYTYHRALVVAWPRSRRGLLPYTPDSAAAALELAERRLQHLKAGGSGPVPSPSASGPSWGHRHDPAVLQQHLSRIECLQPHEPEAQGLGRVEWEAKLAVEAAVSWALQAGAGRTQRSKQKSWGAAAAEEGGRAALQRALQLVTAPQVVMLCGEEWRVRAGMRLLKALSGVAGLNLKDAGLQAAVAGAASSMASSDSFGEGVLSLATQHVERQLTGCYMLAMHVEMPALLQALLKEPVVHRALRRQHPDAVRLAEARMQYLEPRVAGGVPRPDFSLPHVSYPHDPKVAQFLRDAGQEHWFGGFTSIAEARKFVDQHLSSHAQQRYGFRVLASCSGQGRSSRVHVSKSRDVYDQRVATYHSEVEELREVRGMLRAAAGIAAGVAATGAMSHALQPAPQQAMQQPALALLPAAQWHQQPAAAAPVHQVQAPAPVAQIGLAQQGAARVAPVHGGGQLAGSATWTRTDGSAHGLVPPQMQGPPLQASKPGTAGTRALTAPGMGAWAQLQRQHQLLQAQRLQAVQACNAGGGGHVPEVVDLTDE
eukprot:XP_001697149.1 predicted protein [Chlamydomonas reinhardtii]